MMRYNIEKLLTWICMLRTMYLIYNVSNIFQVKNSVLS